MHDYIIKTPRLGLRKWKNSDIERFAQINRNREVMRYFPNILCEEQTRSMVKRIDRHFDRHQFGFYAVEKLENKTFIGFIGLQHQYFKSHFTPCIEIGWRLQKSEWGQGFAPEGAKACMKYAFETPGLEKIYSFTSKYNAQSEKVMIKIGMEKIGEFDHPQIKQKHYLQKHVLYKIDKGRFFYLWS